MKLSLFDHPFTLTVILILFFSFFAVKEFYSLKKKVKIVSCEAIKTSVTQAVSEMKSRENAVFFSGQIISIDDLLRRKYLETYYECPSGGAYMINSYGEVYCSYHDCKSGT